MRRALAAVVGLYLLCALIGRLVEAMGAVRCHCSPDCWCQSPMLSAFRWVMPWGHRSDPVPHSHDAA